MNRQQALGGVELDNSYARLPGQFHQRTGPAPVAAPRLIRLNHDLARSLGIEPETLERPAGVEWLAGNRPAVGSEPLAMAYAGHQFGNWVPQLGDGRALLLGEVFDRDGVRRDLQLKGSGPTRFSRGGDGRASIGPVVREYIASEAMAALGIPTTRALAALATGEKVLRRDGPEPGGILCRVARSHVRVGTFEYFGRNGDPDSVRTLADYVIDRHHPDLAGQAGRYAALFERVVGATAALVARWMPVGFIHGVMNTDNTSIVGETIDYGPFGFIDAFDPATVYSSIDRGGRYAWNQQPKVAHWNLARLGECLLPLLDESAEAALERANAILETFPRAFETRFHAQLCAKIGIDTPREGDVDLAFDLLGHMHEGRADLTLTFRRLSALPGDDDRADGPLRELFDQPSAVDGWLARWRRRLQGETRGDFDRQAAMQRVNPAFVLRNHLAQWAADAAVEHLDFAPMHRLVDVLARPFDDQPEHADLARPPEPEERVLETFCGT
ncbi:MAG: YdiU family protein [Gammaproteobacteria bacterium]|jgi:uncharacterized protein YdiU (UPF0061 family)|nr:YdiU family protein [Gammaproteobacteria bacterium]